MVYARFCVVTSHTKNKKTVVVTTAWNKLSSEKGGNNTLNSTLLEPMEELPDALDVTNAVSPAAEIEENKSLKSP